MEMFLMLVAMSFLGAGVSAALFGAATQGQKRETGPWNARRPAEPQRFFVSGEAPQKSADAPAPMPPAVVPEPVPIELLLAQIERHVRLEQAAAESFHSMPTEKSLHSRTSSPLFN